jgi:ATP-binding cassette subfamily B protein
VLGFLARYRRMAAAAVGLLFFNISMEMALPYVSGQAINQLQAAAKNHLPLDPWRMAEIFFALAAVRAAGAFTAGRVRNFLVQSTLKDLRAAYFNAVQRLSFSYHDKTNTGELISRGTGDITRLQEFLFACLFLGFDISLAMIATVFLIARISLLCGIVTFLAITPALALIHYYARRLHPRWRKVHDLHGALTTTIQENIAGVRVVKAFAREKDEITKFTGRQGTLLDHALSTAGYWASRVPMAQFIFGLSMPLVLWVGGSDVIAGRISVGSLTAMVLYLIGIVGRMQVVGQFVSIIQNASASAERVMEVIEEDPVIRGGSQRLAGRGGARVTFSQVDFAYPGHSSSVLHDVTFEAKPGATVAIVGATGAGKSSLAHLIPRFYDATAGTVRIDGVNVKELDLRELRRSVGMIFQETVLFSATVAENVAYGRPEATPEQIVAATRAAHAHEFIMQLKEGYETIIGERGISLSGGQKQRLAIARAFLLDPRILILDDATSSLDAKTERLIQEDMRRVCLGRTAFVIAHRLTSVQHADHVIVLREGRIVEQGTPLELERDGTLFRELFREQWQDRPDTAGAAGVAA